MEVDDHSAATAAPRVTSEPSQRSNIQDSVREQSNHLTESDAGPSRRRPYPESIHTLSTTDGSTSGRPSTIMQHIVGDKGAERPSLGRRISNAMSRTRRNTAERGSSTGKDKADGRLVQSIPSSRGGKNVRNRSDSKRRRINGNFSPTDSPEMPAAALPVSMTLEDVNEADVNGEAVEVIPEEDQEQALNATGDEASSDGLLAQSQYQPASQTTVAAAPLVSPAEQPVIEASSGLNEARATSTDVQPATTQTAEIVPLTDTDPLLDDRLQVLSNIRNILGADVVRSLPDVVRAQSIRRVEASHPSVTNTQSTDEPSTVSAVESSMSATSDRSSLVPQSQLSSLPTLPPSTLNLLEDLEGTENTPDTHSPQGQWNGFVSSITIPEPISLRPPQQVPESATPRPAIMTQRSSTASFVTAATQTTGELANSTPSNLNMPPPRMLHSNSTNSSSVAETLQTPRGEEGRRRRVGGGLAERVGSWFGLGNTDRTNNTSSNRSDSQGPLPGRTRDEADTPNLVPGLPGGAEDRQADAGSASQTTTPPAPQRLPQGAVMMIQGFVQTSVPNQANSDASDGQAAEPQATPDAGAANRERATETVQQEFPSYSSSGLPETFEVPVSTTPPVDRASAHDATSADAGSSERPGQTRRASESNVNSTSSRTGRNARGLFGSRFRSNADRNQNDMPTFNDQVRMLAGLLSVATAATASSLLSLPEGSEAAQAANGATGQQAPSSGPRAALASLRSRLRGNHGNQGPLESAGLETVLRNYMRRAMNPSNQDDQSSGHANETDGSGRNNDLTGSEDRPSLATILPNADSASFEEFLNTMQMGLVQAMREFQANGGAANDRNSSTESSDQPPPSLNHPTVPSMTTEPIPFSMDVDGTEGETPSRDAPELNEQTARDPASESTEEQDGPRRLNFFRMYQFPARDQPPPANAPGPGDSAPPSSLIPVVIVGVRSINRDVNSIAAGLGANGQFPLADDDDDLPPENRQRTNQSNTSESARQSSTGGPGIVPPPEPSSGNQESAGHSNLTDATSPHVNVNPEHRSRIVRALRALVQRDEQRARQEAEEAARAATLSTNNYAIWVVGGNYPAGHPILTIPHLFTGDLNHEDLWALAEALGQVKPPVATKEDIAKSGLKVVNGADIPKAVQEGNIHDMCLDRCLVSFHRLP